MVLPEHCRSIRYWRQLDHSQFRDPAQALPLLWETELAPGETGRAMRFLQG